MVWERKWKWKSLSHLQLFATPWTVTCQALLSMGLVQARILEWVAIPFSRGCFQPSNQTQVSHIVSRFFTSWATRERPPPQWMNEWLVDFGYFHVCIQTAFIQNKWLYKHTYIICHVLRDPLCTTREYMLPKAVNFWLLLKLDSLDPLVKWARMSQISCHPQHLSLILQHSYVLNLKVYWEWQRHVC